MSVKTFLGIALIALGLIAFVYTTRAWDLYAATHTATPILGAVSIVGGVVALLVGRKSVRRLASSR